MPTFTTNYGDQPLSDEAYWDREAFLLLQAGEGMEPGMDLLFAAGSGTYKLRKTKSSLLITSMSYAHYGSLSEPLRAALDRQLARKRKKKIQRNLPAWW